MRLIASVLLALVACSSATSLTRRELQYAMNPDSWGWGRYASDGTAAGDTAAALASTAMWLFEGGGDRQGPNVYFTEALKRGVHDWMFYSDACAMVKMRQSEAEYDLLLVGARRLFPDSAFVCPRPSGPRRQAAP